MPDLQELEILLNDGYGNLKISITLVAIVAIISAILKIWVKFFWNMDGKFLSIMWKTLPKWAIWKYKILFFPFFLIFHY